MGKTSASVFGWVLVVVGVLGFIPNPIVGSGGIFVTDLLHNLVHIISGAIFLWAAYSAPMKAGAVMKTFGVIYLLLAVLGFFSSGDMLLGLISSNMADTYLHLVLGIVFVLAGVKAGKAMAPQPMM
ncbi:MAG: TonB-dependent siderophore receptor [Parcubacteria group bacterium]|nr:TonB-dependent siderophore receptor [Parcubacteria group bacterium]